MLKIRWRSLNGTAGKDPAAWLLPSSEFDLPRDYRSDLPDLGLLQYGLFPFGLRSDFSDTIFVVPEESDQARMTPDGSFRIYRSRDRGASWQALTRGLPQTNAYMNVMRMATAADALDPAGVYVGTQGGHVFASRDAGETWEAIFGYLPPIYSVETAVVAA